jgi:integrase
VKRDSAEQPDDDLRELQMKKNQYGPKGETIVVRYQRGLFLPVPGVGSLERIADGHARVYAVGRLSLLYLPATLTLQWRRAMRAAGLKATLHSLRHTHASTLIASGLDVLTPLERAISAGAASQARRGPLSCRFAACD